LDAAGFLFIGLALFGSRRSSCLLVVFLLVDRFAVAVGFVPEFAALGLAHFAVRFGRRGVSGQFGFTLVKPVGFFGRQLAGGNALVNAFLLVVNALLNAGGGSRGLGKGGTTGSKHDGGNHGLNFHDELLLDIGHGKNSMGMQRMGRQSRTTIALQSYVNRFVAAAAPPH
jgi:hypothetical protein